MLEREELLESHAEEKGESIKQSVENLTELPETTVILQHYEGIGVNSAVLYAVQLAKPSLSIVFTLEGNQDTSQKPNYASAVYNETGILSRIRLGQLFAPDMSEAPEVAYTFEAPGMRTDFTTVDRKVVRYADGSYKNFEYILHSDPDFTRFAMQYPGSQRIKDLVVPTSIPIESLQKDAQDANQHCNQGHEQGLWRRLPGKISPELSIYPALYHVSVLANHKRETDLFLEERTIFKEEEVPLVQQLGLPLFSAQEK